MITNFACFKNDKKEKDTQPDYRLSAKVNDEWINIGGGWIKETKDKKKFISFKLNEAMGARAGFHLEMDIPPLQPIKENTKTSDGTDLNDMPF